MLTLRVANMRNAPGGRIPVTDVYIGRAGHGSDGYYGSPILLDAPCPECGATHRFAGATLKCFETYARRRARMDPTYREHVRALHGKTLWCFCAPGPCHGDVLVKLAAELSTP